MHFDEVAVSITDHLSCHPTNIGQSRKHQLQYFIPHCNTKLNQNSFFVSTAKLWIAPQDPQWQFKDDTEYTCIYHLMLQTWNGNG